MKLKVLSALLMGASMSAFVISCDEYREKRADEVEHVERPVTTPPPATTPEDVEERAEAKADVKMDLTNRVSELENEWNQLEAKFEARSDLRTEYETLSKDIKLQLQNAKAQIEQIAPNAPAPATDETKRQLDIKLDELEKRIDQAEERLG